MDKSKSVFKHFSSKMRSVNPPILMVQFKNGNLITSARSKLKFSCYKKDSHPNTRILVAKSRRLCYVGSNSESNGLKITSSRLKLCVLSKNCSAIKLYDADLLRLKPYLKGPNVIDIKGNKTYVEKSSDLTLAFGSKTQQKKINTNAKYKSSSMNSDAMDSILTSNTSIQNTNVALSDENKVSSSIPPRNNSATNVDDVYDLYDIISKEKFEQLDSEAKVFLDLNANIIQQWKIENKYSNFTVQFLENNFLSMNEYRAKLLCYLNYMFCFLKTTYADWRRKNPVSDVPEPFRGEILESFTVNKTMPARLKDKLLAYALVLGLKLNNYCINGNIFASSSKIPFKRITSVAYALGCHVSERKTDGIKVIELKLPLHKFQDLPRKRKK